MVVCRPAMLTVLTTDEEEQAESLTGSRQGNQACFCDIMYAKRGGVTQAKAEISYPLGPLV